MLAASHTGSPEIYGRVAVLMGGWSAEREISLRSGKEVLAALQSQGIDAHGIDAEKDVINVLKDGAYDRVFMILHGRGGEDGCVQGALDLAGIPYTGSGVLGSALAMDKLRAKQICQQAGVRTPRWRAVQSVDEAADCGAEFGYPVIVKPVHEGSSIGVSKARQNEIASAFEQAEPYGDVMVEKFIEGKEVTAAVLDGQALPLVSMRTPRLFYDYEAKYFSDSTEYECPCKLPAGVEDAIKQAALTAYRALGARGWARLDFMLDKQDQEYFIELNTAPGMTDHSLVPIAARAAGLEFPALCERILAATLSASPVAAVRASGSAEFDA